MAVDFMFTGLEEKFRVKAFDKVAEKNKLFTDKQDPSKSFPQMSTDQVYIISCIIQGSNSGLFIQPEVNFSTLEGFDIKFNNRIFKRKFKNKFFA